MTGTIRLVLGDQLSRSLSGLAGLDKERDVVLMAEVIEEVTYVRHHKRKVAFLFSAMRHFADELREEGITIILVEHVMDAIRSLCDRCIVMAAGAKIAEGSPGEVLADPEVVKVYIGEDI